MNREPPSLDDRTVIRSDPAVGAAVQHTPARAEPTVILSALPNIGGWNEPTVIAGSASASISASPTLDQIFVTSPARPIVSGPLMALATPILLPLARLLASQSIKVPEALLRARFEAAFHSFDEATAQAGLPSEDVRLVRRLLVATVDDVVGHLPGVDGAAWRKQSVCAESATEPARFNFFEGLNRVLGEPEPRRDLVELLHTCLALGFQGQYRGRSSASEELDHIRGDVYRVLQQLSPAPATAAGRSSAQATSPGHRAHLAATTLLCMGVVLAASFGGMHHVLTRESDALQAELLALVPNGPVTITESVAPAPDPSAMSPSSSALGSTPASSTEAFLERVRSRLADEIAAGHVALEASSDGLAIEINNSLLFTPGSATLGERFAPVAAQLGYLFDATAGPIQVSGYTDNLKPGRSSPFPSNEALSAARAEAVAKILAQNLDDPGRLSFEGRGEADPIADNDTAEGREKNRRVVIHLSPKAGQ